MTLTIHTSASLHVCSLQSDAITVWLPIKISITILTAGRCILITCYQMVDWRWCHREVVRQLSSCLTSASPPSFNHILTWETDHPLSYFWIMILLIISYSYIFMQVHKSYENRFLRWCYRKFLLECLRIRPVLCNEVPVFTDVENNVNVWSYSYFPSKVQTAGQMSLLISLMATSLSPITQAARAQSYYSGESAVCWEQSQLLSTFMSTSATKQVTLIIWINLYACVQYPQTCKAERQM